MKIGQRTVYTGKATHVTLLRGVLVGAALVAGLTTTIIGGAGAAQADSTALRTPVPDECGVTTANDYTNLVTSIVSAGTNLQNGPYASCAHWTWLTGGTKFEPYCWEYNSYDSIWTYGRATYNGRLWYGWVLEDRLNTHFSGDGTDLTTNCYF